MRESYQLVKSKIFIFSFVFNHHEYERSAQAHHDCCEFDRFRKVVRLLVRNRLVACLLLSLVDGGSAGVVAVRCRRTLSEHLRQNVDCGHVDKGAS